MMRIDEKRSKIKFFDDKTFRISIGGSGNLSWLNENGRSGQGALDRFARLNNEYEQLSAPGSFSRIGVDYEFDGEKESFLGTIERIHRGKNGSYLIKGRLEDDYKALDDVIENNDITGHAFRKRHNQFNAPQEDVIVKNTVIHIDTFTYKEIEKEINSEDFQSSYNLDDSANINYRLPYPSNRTVLAASAGSPQARTASFDQLNFDKTLSFSGSDASLDLNANITPSVSATFNSPDSWWDYLDPSKYSVDLGIGLNWANSVSLNTGTDNGTFPLPGKTINGPSLSLPITGPVSARLSSGLDLSATASIPGLQNTYTIGASQELGYNANISTNGIASNATSSRVKTTVPSLDTITGLKLSATASPAIDLSIGMLVPDGIPFFGGDSLASIDGKLALPVTFDMKFDSETLATIGISAIYDAGFNALTFLPDGGLNTTLASGTFYSWESNNLL